MKKILVALSVAAMLAGGASMVGADTDENGGKTAKGERGAAGAEASGVETFTICDGGATEAVIQNLQDAPATVGEGAFVFLTSSSLPAPATGDSDTITVTLTGEASMGGVNGNDVIEVKAQLDGVDMAPLGPISFHSGIAADSHSAMWCKRVPAGAHTVQILWHTLDLGTAGTVTGTLDDYVVRVERTN